MDLYKQFKSHNARNGIPKHGTAQDDYDEREERKSEDDFEVQDAGYGNQSRPNQRTSNNRLVDSHILKQPKRSL